MGDLVRHRAEQEAPRAGHALVADDDEVGLRLLGHVEDRVGGIALPRVLLDLDPGRLRDLLGTQGERRSIALEAHGQRYVLLRPQTLSGELLVAGVSRHEGTTTTVQLVAAPVGTGARRTPPVLQGGDPLDLTARMLYFDEDTRRLVAYEDIVMGGLGLVSVSIQRSQMADEVTELEIPEDAETPEGTIPPEQEVEPGEGLPDEDRVTPTDPVSPLPDPSDGGVG